MKNRWKSAIIKLSIGLVCLLITLTMMTESSAQVPRKKLVHDPVMIQENGVYYLFATGRGISRMKSTDLVNWDFMEPIFNDSPQWAVDAIPGFRGHIWAPDVSFHNGQYYVYYSCSQFAKNTSAIGVVTNVTLDPESTDYKWVDHGKVIQSVPGRDMWNAIDPNLILDSVGIPWLAFGSFWNGIEMVKLSADLLSVAQPEEWHALARRERTFNLKATDPGDGAIEAPFIFKKGDFYYLFVSFDLCCRGVNSTYKIMVGRSMNVTGPYVDKNGVDMYDGGGSLVLEGNEDWHGLGHNATYTFNNIDYIIYHAYDAHDNGAPKLQVKTLGWDENMWPFVKDIK